MSTADSTPSDRYKVVVNHEGQYSIWPDEAPIPPGWRETGERGDKRACLDHIEKTWDDMRPLSLRGRSGPPPA